MIEWTATRGVLDVCQVRTEPRMGRHASQFVCCLQARSQTRARKRRLHGDVAAVLAMLCHAGRLHGLCSVASICDMVTRNRTQSSLSTWDRAAKEVLQAAMLAHAFALQQVWVAGESGTLQSVGQVPPRSVVTCLSRKAVRSRHACSNSAGYFCPGKASAYRPESRETAVNKPNPLS